MNWRATARRGVPWVNESHPERNSDVVLFLDTFAEARRGAAGSLDASVRAAGALAELYLREKDRVGVVSFGGVLNWLTVWSGPVQLYRIVDSLLDAEIWLSYVWKDIDVIPTRTLPPRALVLALTPLLDDRAIGALADLRTRGFDLAIIEVYPCPTSSRARRRASSSRSGCGSCVARRSAPATGRWVCPSWSGATRCRSKLRSRR